MVYCGDDIVAVQPGNDRDGCLHPSKVIIWDNFYANDYCPRRLFLGPWRAVNLPDVMLNPTGMIETDLLLLDLMSLFKNKRQKTKAICVQSIWPRGAKRLAKRGVPTHFLLFPIILTRPWFSNEFC